MEFAIRIGTSRGKIVRLLIIAAVLILAGMVLGAADVSDYVPISGWIPAIIGLIVAAVALYRLLARPVVMTLDQTGIRVPRQIQLLPWRRIESTRGFSRSGFTRFLLVRLIEPKNIPGFASGQRSAGLLAPKVEPDEIALNLTGAGVRLDELIAAIERVRQIVAAVQQPPAGEEELDEYGEPVQPPEPADPLSDPVVQRIADTNATIAGALRWMITIFAPLFAIFAVWAILAVSEAGDFLILLIGAGAIAAIWLIASPIVLLVKTTADRCPNCKQPVRYFKKHANRPLTCPGCRHVWPAGQFRIT